MSQRYEIEDLEPGMYVSELDRPWSETPFLFQGFFIDSPEQIDELRQYCDYVHVDLLRKRDSQWHQRLALSGGRKKAELETRSAVRTATGGGDEPDIYPVLLPMEDELQAAKASQGIAEKALQKILVDLKRGKDLVLTQAREAVSGLVESVIRNPNALIWLSQMKTLDNYTYGHSIDVCGYLLAFGRHLGLTKSELQVLGLGGLLLDIGKAQLPLPLLQKRGKLTNEEFELIRSHVVLGLEALRSAKGVPARVLEMVRDHHERMDGSGYPNATDGEQLGVFARMAAIVDTFDAITSERPYASALSSHQALRRLYEWRESQFHTGLVEQFIECLGTYPVGSIVELNTGQIAIVLAQNRFRQLKPKLMLVMDSSKKLYGTMDVLDMINDPVDANDNPVEIERALEPGMHGIYPRDFYL
ncbi:MAG: HD-GYP domain-containing protein [Proteobacteria bacterium]|nr:MAG: HD-GYP domain-containing protein [Pseudomonadota bacterium]